MSIDISVQQQLLPAVVVLVMVSVGMELRGEQFRALLRTPRLPILGTIIHTLSFPLIGAIIVLVIKAFNLNVADATLAGILLIAACPSGGFSNVLVMIAGANLPLSVLLTAISSLFAFISVPLLVAGSAFVLADLDQPVRLPVGATLIRLLVLVLIPVGVGMWLRARWPGPIKSLLKPLQNGGQVLLYICVALLVWENVDTVRQYAGDALPWSLLLCVLNLLLCFRFARLAGFQTEDCVTIALEGSIRNLAVALLIAVNVLDRMDIAVLPTVYFIAVLIVAIAFAKLWRRMVAMPVSN